MVQVTLNWRFFELPNESLPNLEVEFTYLQTGAIGNGLMSEDHGAVSEVFYLDSLLSAAIDFLFDPLVSSQNSELDLEGLLVVNQEVEEITTSGTEEEEALGGLGFLEDENLLDPVEFHNAVDVRFALVQVAPVVAGEFDALEHDG